MVDTHWAGSGGAKIYHQSGQFESTMKTSISIGGQTKGVSFIPGTSSLASANTNDKIYQLSGIMDEATIKTSISVTAIDSNLFGVVYIDPNHAYGGSSADKYYLGSGIFELTLKDSQAQANPDPKDIAYVVADDTVPTVGWAFGENTKFKLYSGVLTATILTSRNVNAIDDEGYGVSWDGTNTPWAGGEANKLYLQSGQFLATLSTSLDVAAVDTGMGGLEDAEQLAGGAAAPFWTQSKVSSIAFGLASA